MAQKVVITLTDDMSGGEAEETVEFGLDGVGYQIDLGSKNADKLRKALAPFVASARRTTPAKRGRRPSPSNGTSKPSEVRAWARDNGYDVPAKGRIPGGVMDAYIAIHGG